ncbi:MAG: hypothetical protein QNJ16_19890 [Rhodobacter sp.]|nr:hypothetical protein [Rhodobacter sp.]
MFLSLTHAGRVFDGFTRADLETQGVPEAVIAAAEAAALATERKRQVRSSIRRTAGDDASLLGTTADCTALLLYEMAKMAATIAGAGTVAEIKAAAQPFADLTAPFLAAVEDGSVKLPVLIKGEATALAEIQTRATAVADAIA